MARSHVVVGGVGEFEMCECMFCGEIHKIDKRIRMPIGKAVIHLEEYMKRHKIRLESKWRKDVEKLKVDKSKLKIVKVSLCPSCKFGMSYIVG